MANQIGDIIRFQDERLFNGAVNIDWCLDSPERASKAASAFVFHGPTYHGVTQGDIGITHGHRLQDTASFTHSIVRSCAGLTEKPFTLAIAGYGTGKSHLALTLAEMLSNPESSAATAALSSLRSADNSIADETEQLLRGLGKPCLVLSLNGMRNFDLTAEISKQIITQLHAHDLDTSPIDNLRPRFSQAARLVELSNSEFIQALLEHSDLPTKNTILENLKSQDEQTYALVHSFFEQKGMPIRVLGGESLKDLFDITCKEYCGAASEKPFCCVLVLFDEFGRYAEFATMKRQIAGSGVLQHLFEGVQGNSDKASFIGFIQFELNSYVQRIAPEFQNDIIRVTTRYQNSDKAYLSTNLETLIAHLIEKKANVINEWFDNGESKKVVSGTMSYINKWFPLSRQHHLWGNRDLFHKVIRKGCWPLSPYAVWLLYYLSAAGRHLQERSALSLLSNTIAEHQKRPAEIDGHPCELFATDLLSEELLQEFISSEESDQQGTIAHSYATVQTKYGNKLDQTHNTILRSIVLAAKLGLSATDKDDAEVALSCLSGVSSHETQRSLKELQDDYNVIEWDKSFKLFDILGEAVPRTQFLSFLRQRVASTFDEQGKADLFASHISEWCKDIEDLECDFSEENEISTKEWRYQYATSNLTTLPNHIEFAVENWSNALSVSDSRGTVIYCYVGLNQDIDKIESDTSNLLRSSAKKVGQPCLPIFVIFLIDENGDMGRMMAELAVLADKVSEQDRARFGNLIGAHEEKSRQHLASLVDDAIKRRQYVTGLREPLEARRLSPLGTKLFAAVYHKSLPFPFDGFSTARGNAADSCLQLTTELLNGRLDFDSCSSKPQKVRNRALAILQRSWECFARDGKISMPKNTVARSIIMAWRKKLDADDLQFKIAEELRAACLPPYGANVASVGMLFGVFLAPRRDSVYIVDQDGNQLDVGQWLQGDIFQSKALDFKKIGNAEIINIGEVSAEWERLLEDWEQAETHRDKIQYLEQAMELKERVSVPPTLTYKYVHLEEVVKKTLQIIRDVEKKQEEAWGRIDKGMRYKDAAQVSWGAADLARLLKQMEDQLGDWTDEEKANIENEIGRARQMVVEVFPEWLSSQTLLTDNPDEIGKFKHRLGTRVYDSLTLLNFHEEAQFLKERVDQQVRNAQVQAEAMRLIQEVDAWLTEHSEVFRIVRVAEIRSLLTPGKEFSKKLQVNARQVNLPELDAIRTRISSFVTELKKAEANLRKKAENLWNSKIREYSDLEPFIQDVNELMQTYEGCHTDLEDLRAMRKILAIFQDCYHSLSNLDLSWKNYDALIVNLKTEAETKYGDEDPPPWDIQETINVFVQETSKKRKSAGKEWLNSLEMLEESIESMEIEQADVLLQKAQKLSPLLSLQQCKTAGRIAKKAEQRCQELKVDWLIQRFKELSEDSKKRFLKRIEDTSGV